MKIRIGVLAVGLTVLAIVSTTPEAAFARGPQQRGDFAISTHERTDGWYGVINGTWKMSGAVSDSGTLWGVYNEYDRLWLEGEFGTMIIWADYDFAGTHTFVVLEGTGLYEAWIGAVGVWDFRGNPGGPGDWWNTSRRLDGFLP